MSWRTNPVALHDAIATAVLSAFGEKEGRLWLEEPLASLGGRAPAALLDDPLGAQMVLEELRCAEQRRDGRRLGAIS